MIRLKIDLLKLTGAKTFTAKDGAEFLAFPIKANSVFVGKNGAHYLDLTLMDNKQGRDEYENDGFCVIDVGKERREAGEKGQILGNWKNLDGGNQRQGRDVSAQEATKKRVTNETQPEDETDDIPF